MSDEGKLNVTQLLMELKEGVAKLDTKMEQLKKTDDKADEALNLSRENERNIKRLEGIVYKVLYLGVGGVVLALVVYIIEKMIGD